MPTCSRGPGPRLTAPGEEVDLRSLRPGDGERRPIAIAQAALERVRSIIRKGPEYASRNRPYLGRNVGNLRRLGVVALTEDEVRVVWSLVSRCLTHKREYWGPVMRYARLFTPGTVVRGLNPRPAYSRRNAYDHATASGLLYCEGFACHGFPHERMGWCVDGDGVVVEPTFPEPGTAYFGVILLPDYMRRAFVASRDDDGEDRFRGVYGAGRSCPLPDPAVDIVHDLGRDIPASIRDWALTADIHQVQPQEPPAWVLDQLRLGDRDPS